MAGASLLAVFLRGGVLPDAATDQPGQHDVPSPAHRGVGLRVPAQGDGGCGLARQGGEGFGLQADHGGQYRAGQGGEFSDRREVAEPLPGASGEAVAATGSGIAPKSCAAGSSAVTPGGCLWACWTISSHAQGGEGVTDMPGLGGTGHRAADFGGAGSGSGFSRGVVIGETLAGPVGAGPAQAVQCACAGGRVHREGQGASAPRVWCQGEHCGGQPQQLRGGWSVPAGQSLRRSCPGWRPGAGRETDGCADSGGVCGPGLPGPRGGRDRRFAFRASVGG